MTATIRVVVNRRPVVLTADPSMIPGREGSVYPDPTDPAFVIKIPHSPEDGNWRQKIKIMLKNRLYSPNVAWPVKRVLSADGKRVIGCRMPFAANKWPIVCAYSSDATTRWMHADYRFRLQVAKNLVTAIATVHQHGCVVGDISETNVLVGKDGSVCLIDVDSMQISRDGHTYRCCVGTGEYTPAELHGPEFSSVDRIPQSDVFGMGSLVFQLLVGPGNHPFVAHYLGNGNSLTLLQRIEQGVWAYSGNHPEYVPRTAAPFCLIHPVLQPLMEACFVDGHVDPLKRPLPADWINALSEVQQDADFVTHIAPQLETAAHAEHAATVAQVLQSYVHAPHAGSRVGKRTQLHCASPIRQSPRNRRFRFAVFNRRTLQAAAVVTVVLAVAMTGWWLLPRTPSSVYLKKRGEHTLPTPAMYEAITEQGDPLPRYRSMFPEFDSSQTAGHHTSQEKTK